MIKKSYKLSYILIMSSFFLTSSFSKGVTLSDISVLIIVLTLLFFGGRRVMNKRVFTSVFLYFFYLFITSTILIIYPAKLNYLSYFYIIREMSYIIIFFFLIKFVKEHYVFSHRVLKMMIILNLLYAMYSIATKKVAYYGIGTLATIAPSQSGIIYFIIFVILIKYYNDKKEIKYLFMAALSFVSIIFTVSRTSALGVFVFGIIYVTCNFVLSKRKYSKRKVFFSSFAFFLFFLFIFSQLFGQRFDFHFLQKVFFRFGYLKDSILLRKSISKNFFQKITQNKINRVIFGFGKSIPEVLNKTSVLAVDNQYTRSIIESGILGTALWINLLLSILKYVLIEADLNIKVLTLSLLGSYFAMGFGYEVFQVSRSGLGFWIALAIIVT